MLSLKIEDIFCVYPDSGSSCGNLYTWLFYFQKSYFPPFAINSFHACQGRLLLTMHSEQFQCLEALTQKERGSSSLRMSKAQS